MAGRLGRELRHAGPLKVLPNGIPASLTGFPGTGFRQSYGLTVDPFDTQWVANQQSVNAARHREARL